MLKYFAELIYPDHCVLCGTRTGPAQTLCTACLGDLPVNRNACQRCACPLPVDTLHALCGQCLRKPPTFDSAWSAFVYQQPLEWMIQQLKFNAKLFMGPLLVQLALRHMPFQSTHAQCIIPVPLYPRRYRERGFNQSQVLAKEFSRCFGIPVDNRSCRKVRSTPPQTGRTAAQRRSNVRHAFCFDKLAAYDHVVIVDDVITTGSTVSEMTKIIKSAGVERVDVWSIARAPLNYR